MSDQVFRLESPFDCSAQEIFDWHARPGAFERLVPPWEHVRLQGSAAVLQAGSQQTVTVPLGPRRVAWRSEMVEVIPGASFRDVQVQGPFAKWEHSHRMRDQGTGSVLEDEVTYRLPLGALGQALAGGGVCRRLQRLFTYRHRILGEDLGRHARWAQKGPLDVLVSGASGFVGQALCAFLSTGGHRIRRLVRSTPRSKAEFLWNPRTGAVDPAAVEGCDAVIHLAGEKIAAGRWSRAQKLRILESRVLGTRAVANAIRVAKRKPSAFLCASAIGIFGSRGDYELDEGSSPGADFLSHVCTEWEKEASGVTGVRSVSLRFGVILSPAGGALAKMLLPFKLGLGGRIGSGEQWMSWIALDDVLGAVQQALMDSEMCGPVNVVGPNPVTNAEFSALLGRVLSRPSFAPLPAPVARALLGEMADALLLGSQRVRPKRLLEAGFEFLHPSLEGALRHQLGS